MMKKLLVLALVLAITSVSSASILFWSDAAGAPINDITVALGSTVVIYLASSDDQAYPEKWIDDSAANIASIVSITALPTAGDDPTVKDPAASGYPGWWTVEAADFSPPSAIEAGPQYEVVISGDILGSDIVAAAVYGENSIVEINVIPEPITVALLGLGGLFIRRKK